MNRLALVLMGTLVLAGCNRHSDKPAPKPEQAKTAKPKAVAFDPSFVGVSGKWVSKPGSLGDGKFLQMDIASAGAYTMEVRAQMDKGFQVFETIRGNAKLANHDLTGSFSEAAKPKTTIAGIGNWSAVIDDAKKNMTLKGSDGKSYSLVRDGF